MRSRANLLNPQAWGSRDMAKKQNRRPTRGARKPRKYKRVGRKVEKPHNGGTWTEARKRSFIMSALRRAQWPVKYQAIKNAYIDDGINPKTGRRCKLHECEECGDCFPAKDMQADHINSVIPLTGFDSWDKVIERMFCEIEGYQALCKDCHKIKTKEENKIRRENKKK